MKTWKKIEDTRKRTNEIVTLKNRNEERIQKVRSPTADSAENLRLPVAKRAVTATVHPELHGQQAEARGEAQGPGGHLPVQARRGQADPDAGATKRPEEEALGLQARD